MRSITANENGSGPARPNTRSRLRTEVGRTTAAPLLCGKRSLPLTRMLGRPPRPSTYPARALSTWPAFSGRVSAIPNLHADSAPLHICAYPCVSPRAHRPLVGDSSASERHKPPPNAKQPGCHDRVALLGEGGRSPVLVRSMPRRCGADLPRLWRVCGVGPTTTRCSSQATPPPLPEPPGRRTEAIAPGSPDRLRRAFRAARRVASRARTPAGRCPPPPPRPARS